MIVTSAAAFLAACSHQSHPPRHAPTARAAFLVAPACSELAAESRQDNAYMASAATIDLARARAQHDELARALGADLPVALFAGAADCPDGMFPNNVFATTRGRLIIGRMRHPVRQREAARADIRAWFRDVLGYALVDLSQRDCVAELTGALVIDRARGIGYCGLSERCDLAGAQAMHDAFGLRLTFAFALAPGEYHTNVVLAVLAGRAALIAADGFAERADAEAIASVYGSGAVWLDREQKAAFAANAITLAPQRVWMSRRAADALTPAQYLALARHGFAVGAVALDEVEQAGGSLRCCVAEIY
ncbi:MAG: amidinotransferase [Xanthomonadales bacterium]|nr:amidinotransferase [Xanthomonadales bacterium]MDL1868167.1 amidinotransferase [Gammaproteobacteria bacterium PRO6]